MTGFVNVQVKNLEQQAAKFNHQVDFAEILGEVCESLPISSENGGTG